MSNLDRNVRLNRHPPARLFSEHFVGRGLLLAQERGTCTAMNKYYHSSFSADKLHSNVQTLEPGESAVNFNLPFTRRKVTATVMGRMHA